MRRPGQEGSAAQGLGLRDEKYRLAPESVVVVVLLARRFALAARATRARLVG
jgi:hypothetical protein